MEIFPEICNFSRICEAPKTLIALQSSVLISMINRILEPEVMESSEEAMAYDSMDHHAVNIQFVQDLIAAGCPDRGSVLDLGTGTAQIPIELCRMLPAIRIVGIDLSVEMLVLAEKNIAASPFKEKIRTEKLDAKKISDQAEQYDVCVSNSIVHHIPVPADVFSQAVQVTRPGGLLFWRDLVRPESDAEVRHLVQTYAGQENEHQQRLFSDSLYAALRLEEVQDFVANLDFDPASVTQTSDRHWTWSAKK